MYIISDDLLWDFYKFFWLQSCVQVISEKTYCSKILFAIWKACLYQNDLNRNSYRTGNEPRIIPSFSFIQNQKQESNFQQVGGLVTRLTFQFN